MMSALRERRRKIKASLEIDLNDYLLEWKVETEESPLRLKPKSCLRNRKKSTITAWVKAISAVTKTKPVPDEDDKYIRIALLSGDETVHASVFQSGTVMFQGKDYEKWLVKNVKKTVSLFRKNLAAITRSDSAESALAKPDSDEMRDINLNETFIINSQVNYEDNRSSNEDNQLIQTTSSAPPKVTGSGELNTSGTLKEHERSCNINVLNNDIQLSQLCVELELCIICNKDQTDDMIQCHKCETWIHYDCDVDSIIEDETEGRRYLCPPCRKSSKTHIPNNVKSKKRRAVYTRAVAKRDKIESPPNVKDIRSSPNGTSYFVPINNDSGSSNLNKQNKHLINEDDDDESDDVNESLSQNKHIMDENENSDTDEWMDDDDLFRESYSLVSDENDKLHDSYSIQSKSLQASENLENIWSRDTVSSMVEDNTESAGMMSNCIGEDEMNNSTTEVIQNHAVSSEDISLLLLNCINGNPDNYKLSSIDTYEDSSLQMIPTLSDVDSQKGRESTPAEELIPIQSAIVEDQKVEDSYQATGQFSISSNVGVNNHEMEGLNLTETDSDGTKNSELSSCAPSSQEETNSETEETARHSLQRRVECETEMELLTKKNEVLTVLNRELNEEICMLNQQIITKTTNIGQLEMKIALDKEEYNENITLAEENINNLKAQVEYLQEINERNESAFTEEYEKLRDQISQLHTEGISESTKQRCEEISNLNEQIRKIVRQIDQLENENASLKLKLDKDMELTEDDKESSSPTNTDEVTEVYTVTDHIKGLPDIKGNTCFIISAIHALCRILPLDDESLTGRFATILKTTKALLDGIDYAGSNISRDLWKLVEENWPEYSRDDGRSTQGDVAEFIMRYVEKLEEEQKDSTVSIQTIVTSSTKCTNTKCKALNKINSELETITMTSQIPNESKLSLQQVIDGFTPQLGTSYSTMCKKCGKEMVESCALLLPTPTIILQVDKVRAVGNKDNVEIYTNQTVTIPLHNSTKGQKYNVTDVIVHRGSRSTNGHYITTHFNAAQNRWEYLNNEKGRVLTDEQANQINKQGIIYVLKASSDDEVLDKSIDEYPKYHKPKRLDRGMNYGNNTGGTGQKGGETHQIYRNDISSEVQSKQITREKHMRIKGICINYNRGECYRGQRCRYKHVKLNDYSTAENISKNVQLSQKPSNDHSELQSESTRNVGEVCREFSLHGHCKIGNFCQLKHEKPNSNDHTNNYNRHTTEIGNHPTNKSKQICPQYKFGRCKNYDICKETYDHPRRCRDMLTFGECEFGDNCRFYHPKICKFSMDKLLCTDLSCPYFHLRWTRRFAEERRNNLHSDFNDRPANRNFNRNIFDNHKSSESGTGNQQVHDNSYSNDVSVNQYHSEGHYPGAEGELSLTRENNFLYQQIMDNRNAFKENFKQLQDMVNNSISAQIQVPPVPALNQPNPPIVQAAQNHYSPLLNAYPADPAYQNQDHPLQNAYQANLAYQNQDLYPVPVAYPQQYYPQDQNL